MAVDATRRVEFLSWMLFFTLDSRFATGGGAVPVRIAKNGAAVEWSHHNGPEVLLPFT
jgi:hypothetical protein